MGLLLLIPGLILTHNGTTWFTGENSVGHVLNIIGVVLLAAQVLFMLIAGAAVKRTWDRF